MTPIAARLAAAVAGLRHRRQKVAAGVAVSDLADLVADGVALYVAGRAGLDRALPPLGEWTGVAHRGPGPVGPCPVETAMDRIAEVRRAAEAGRVVPGQVDELGEEMTGWYLAARARIEQTAGRLAEAKGRI